VIFRVYYDSGDGHSYEDSITVSGDTIEEIRKKAYIEGDKRGWKIRKCWSECWSEENRIKG